MVGFDDLMGSHRGESEAGMRISSKERYFRSPDIRTFDVSIVTGFFREQKIYHFWCRFILLALNDR